MTTPALRRMDPHPLREWATMLAEAERVLFRAQSGDAAAVLDEMPGLLMQADETPFTDLARLLRYAEATAHHALGDHEATLAACDKLRRHAAAHGDRPWMSCAGSMRAVAMARIGDEEGALAELVAAEILIEGVQRPAFPLAMAIAGLAAGYRRLRLYELALGQLSRMVPLLSSVSTTALPLTHAYKVAKVRTEWGLDLVRQGREEEAAGHFRAAESSLAAAPRIPAYISAREMRASMDLISGICRAYLGRGEQAAFQLRGCYDVVAGFGADREAMACLGLARAAEALEDYDEAARHLARARELADQADWTRIQLDIAYEQTRLMALQEGDTAVSEAYRDYAKLVQQEDAQRRDRLHDAVERRLYRERLHDEYRSLSQRYLTDPETGLPNRRGLELRLPELVAHAQRDGSILSLAFVHILTADGANEVGTDTLKLIVERAYEGLRSNDLMARTGTGELVFVMPGMGEDAVRAFVAWLRRRLLPPGVTGGPQLIIGVAAFKPPPSVAGLVIAADEALREAMRGQSTVPSQRRKKAARN